MPKVIILPRNNVLTLALALIVASASPGVAQVAPTCDAGMDVVAACPGEIHLQAVAEDADGDLLTIAWSSSCPSTTFVPSADVLDPIVLLGPGCNESCVLTLSVDDGDGQPCVDTVTLSTEDLTPPVITLPAPVDPIECDELPEATVTDDCDPAPVLVVDDVRTNGPCADQYTLARTWMATDACGNQSVEMRDLSVVDTNRPLFHCNGVPVQTLVDQVGDMDDFSPGDPGDAPGPGPNYAGCGASLGMVDLDVTNPNNTCTVWHHDYQLPPGACVVGARLTIRWRLTDLLSRVCPAGNRRPTEGIRFNNETSPSLGFGSCFDPFGAALYGDQPFRTAGVATLDLYDFDGVLDLLDGSILTIQTNDDTPIDYAILEIDHLPGDSPCCPQDIGCGDDLPPPIGTWVTDCDPDPSFQVGEQTLPDGRVERSWVAQDRCGNEWKGRQTFTIGDPLVTDVWPPDLRCPRYVTAEPTMPGGAFLPVLGSITDDCDPMPTIVNDRTFGGGDASDFYPCGETLVEFTGTDASGNQTTCVTTVRVMNSSLPAEVSLLPVDSPLRVRRSGAADLEVSFAERTGPIEAFSLYAGRITSGGFTYTHAPVSCHDAPPMIAPGRLAFLTGLSPGDDWYFLVSASNCLDESSVGADTFGIPRPLGSTPCGMLP